MALYKEDIVDIDLEAGTVHRSFAQKIVGEGDSHANRYGVRLRRNGQSVNAGGATCMGYFIRNGNGDTVVVNGGMFSGDTAYVELPQSCYAYDGPFSLVIKLVGGGVTGTMRIVDGTVVNSMIGAPIDPGSVVPDLQSLLAVIDRAETAADVIAGISISMELIEGENYRTIINKEVTS